MRPTGLCRGLVDDDPSPPPPPRACTRTAAIRRPIDRTAGGRPGPCPRSRTRGAAGPGAAQGSRRRSRPTSPWWVTVSPAHSLAEQREHLVHQRAPLARRATPHAADSGRRGRPGTKVHSSRPADSTSSAGQLLGQPHQVAPGQEHGGAQLEPGVVGGGEGQPDQGVEGRGGQDLGQPDRVEPQLVEVVDQPAEARRRRRGATDPIPTPMRTFIGTWDADLGDRHAAPGVRRSGRRWRTTRPGSRRSRVG